MVNNSGAAAALDATFGALSDPTRRAILARLALAPESSVGELARPFAMSLPAISKHLRVLEAAGLLSRSRDGRVHHCRLEARPMRTAADWIEHYREFWEKKFDALGRFLEQTQPKEEKPWPHPYRRSRPPKARSASRARSRPRARGSTTRGPTRSS